MTTLQDQLDEITANTRHLVQAERLAVGERAVAELFASGIEEHILPVGAIAPEFALKDATGRLVRSADLLALGPLVIKFFRGRWCPYCMTELEAWRDLYGTASRARRALGRHRPADRSAKATSWPASTAFPSPCSPTPATPSPSSSASSTPSPSTTATTTFRSSSTSPSSTANQAGACPSPRPTSSARTDRVVFAEAHADFRVRPEPEEALAAAFAHHSR